MHAIYLTEIAKTALNDICDLCQSGNINEAVNELNNFIISKAVLVFGIKRWKKLERKNCLITPVEI